MPADKRTVNVHTYKSIPMPGGKVIETCDQIIYDKIIPRKEKMINSCEHALKEIAFDKDLFGDMYKKKQMEYEDFTIYRAKDAKPLTSTCPKKRRPLLGTFLPGSESRPNKHGDDCCYKVKY